MKITPTFAIGVPTFGKVSVRWAQSYRHMAGPLGSSALELIVYNKPIAEARNELMRDAINNQAEFLFMLGDDVLVQPDTMLRAFSRMRLNPDVQLITGVYWTKGWPTMPYLWKGIQQGPFMDWKYGEWLEVDFAGCDCLMIRLSSQIIALGPEWFATDYLWTSDQGKPAPLMTEDFYFYTKCRKAGIRLWLDTEMQCFHEDRQSGALFGLTPDMPQCGAVLPPLPEPGTDDPDGKVVVADLGAGLNTPWFGEVDKVKIVRFDGNAAVKPDFVCDLRHLPASDGSCDVVHARHVLEHFGRTEAPTILREWLRILRIGGELRLNVPNVLTAMRAILEVEEDKRNPDMYPWWQLYGEQVDSLDRHANGWTPRRLKALLELSGLLEEIVVEEVDEGQNIQATAKKAKDGVLYAFGEAWYEIAKHEGIEVPGLVEDTSEVTASETHDV